MSMIELLVGWIVDLAGGKIAVLGLAFRNDTDDVHVSRTISVISKLRNKGAVVRAFDPMASENMLKIFPHIEFAHDSKFTVVKWITRTMQ